MALNPIAYTENVVRSFLRYQLTAYPFADPGLHRQMRELLSLDRTRRSPLLKGPYVSLSRPFRDGCAVESLVAEGVLHPHLRERIPAAITHLRSHQEQAIRAIVAGRTTLISTGTGSGKTECFLYPIVSQCLQLRDQGAPPGISAVIVYPMNALAEDQLMRLRGLLAGTGIPFGIYVGKTPEGEADVAGVRLRPGASRADYEARLRRAQRAGSGETVYPAEEVCSRQMMRTPGRQPRVLLTNVKQLELLLTRQQDVELFAAARLDFLVFDEAHTFTGALGAETACLIRHLRAFCGAGAERTTCVATSATIVDDRQPEAARSFAARFFGVPAGAVRTVGEDYEAEVWAAARFAAPAPQDAAAVLDRCVRAVDAADDVCDPACGSGSFPLAALRFLTDALYASLQHHRRIRPTGERSLVRLLGIRDGAPDELLVDELIPCPPDHDDFEPRLKAVLRRHVVERCIYAVDLDPLAVELCRLSLWIETMDHTLPFGFLDHKIKCGNALIGAWFDQFRHYPAMAWKNRDGGDKNHTNGVHYAKGARTAALKAFAKERLTPDLKRFLSGPDLFQQDDLLAQAATAHDEALAVLARMHALPVHDAAERERRYRALIGSPAWRSLKEAMDRWCACWFWPADRLACAPLPTTFVDPPLETRAVAARVAAELRFFHWEMEFPDVFRDSGSEPKSGFDAILGNPPWDIAKPSSMEFFSGIDPLYRSYGKQEAVRRQSRYFADEAVERAWLDYGARFRTQSNFVGHAASPFGDPDQNAASQDRFTAARGNENRVLHERWRTARRRAAGFVDPRHPFRHQGSADLNLYKLFLEAAHGLLKDGGRLGFIVPSGLYSDHGTGALRRLFLDRCRWEWLFGIENREEVFPIHRSYKFNPVIVEKGGTTAAIRTAFMRRRLDDWEKAEALATAYTHAQVERFSPKSRAILEIQSQRDLEILEKIYANSVLLGDDGPGGWGIRYATEFHMTNDSRLFPPRPQWEAKGYRPDEYSRWLLGDWRPIEELWAELGVDPSRPQPPEIELEDWLFDASTDPERRAREARFVHGHLLKPGDVARTDWRLRCAQPPYDLLPIPRADLPAGVILSREGDAWIREDDLRDVALPLYQGIMIQPFTPSARGWISGTGLRAKWDYRYPGQLDWDPQFLMSRSHYVTGQDLLRTKIGYRRIARNTDERSFIGTVCPSFPCGDSVFILHVGDDSIDIVSRAVTFLNSFIFDFLFRFRIGGTNLSWYVLEEGALPAKYQVHSWNIFNAFFKLNLVPKQFAPINSISITDTVIDNNYHGALLTSERLRIRSIVDAVSCAEYGCDASELRYILRGSDYSSRTRPNNLDVRGFWRVDRDRDPELRHTVLTLIAIQDLEAKIEAASGDREQGIEAFLTQNHGEGWLLPETLRLADYGLGHDDRAKQPRPVAGRLGPRFYDWQLAQSADESWRECQLHARNLLGEFRYESLRRGDHPPVPDEQSERRVAEHNARYTTDSGSTKRQPELFASDEMRGIHEISSR